jgi:hypothetical protein
MTTWDEIRFDPDLIPEPIEEEYPDIVGYLRSNVRIRQVYMSYVRKPDGIGKPVSGGREVFIRCPSPTHVDRRPSAWMNEVDGTWYCGACGVGGDMLSMVAYSWDWAVPDFQANADQFKAILDSLVEVFHVDLDQIAGQGYIKVASVSESTQDGPTEWPNDFNQGELEWAEQLLKAWDGTGRGMADVISVIERDRKARVENAHVQAGVPEVSEEVSAAIDRELGGHAAVVTSRVASSYEEAVDRGIIVELGVDPEFPHVEWQSALPEDSPLGRAMDALTVDDAPDEFHLWALYTTVGALIGRRVEYLSYRGNVSPSFWTVLSGPSGYRKSSVANPMRAVLAKVAPVRGSQGVKLLHRPASGEAFVASLRREEDGPPDPHTGAPSIAEIPNCASLMHSDELSTLLSVVNRSGGILGPLMTEAYSCIRDEVLANTAALGREAHEVTGPMMCMLSTTQPSRISDMLSVKDVLSGFVNRFTFIHGRPRRRVLLDAQIHADYTVVEDSLRSIEDCLQGGSGLPKALVENPWVFDYEEYHRGKDVHNGPLECFQEWGLTLENRIKDLERSGSEYAADMLRRVDLAVRKLMIIMAINRLATGVDDRPFFVLSDVEQSLLHVENLMGSMEEIGIQIVQSDYSKFEDWIMEKVKEAGPQGVQRRTLHAKMPGFYKKAGIKFADAVNGLVASGAVVDDPRGPANAPPNRKTYWLVSPEYIDS